MTSLTRFGVSLNGGLLRQFDKYVRDNGCPTRSKALEGLIRKSLVENSWETGADIVAGAVVMVYDHHKRELVNKLLDVQHDHQEIIISSQHVHLSHDNCLEVIALKGKPARISSFVNLLKALKGVKHVSLSVVDSD